MTEKGKDIVWRGMIFEWIDSVGVQDVVRDHRKQENTVEVVHVIHVKKDDALSM